MIHQFNIPNNPHKHRQYCTILDDVYLTHHNKDTSDGSAVELISITHDGKLVKAGIDKDTQKLGNKEIYYENKFNDITKYDESIDENIFLLYDDAGVNYLHSFFDLFGRCIYFDILIKEKPIKLGLSEEFWTDSGKNDFIKQWLKLYYGDDLDVVIFKKGKTYKINQITLSNCLYWSPEYTGHQPIMELIKKTVEKIQPIKVNSNGCYISRQDTIKHGWFHPREMANELELIDKIKSELNYDIIELMNYNLIEKIQIFKSYKNIIQQSSASNVNILFSPKGINNIILTNPKLGPWLNPKCQDFSSTSGCNLLILEDIGELILDSTQPNEGDLNNFPWRITDIDGVIDILKQIDNEEI
jgi:hypothetical protein